MLKSVAVEKVNIEDGTYNALWSAYNLKILSSDNIELVTVKTHVGVKGMNCPTRVEVKNGIVNVI